MKLRNLLAIACVSALGGCTLFVLGKAGDLDDFAQTDGSDPNAPKPVDPCAIGPDGGNECAQCISTKCASDLSIACGKTSGDGGVRGYFSAVRSCANDPDEFGSGSACGSYDKSEAGAITNPTIEDHFRQNMTVCLRDNCMRGGDVPACKQCKITLSVTGDTLPLDNPGSPCGQCIANACKLALVQCCSDSTSGGGATLTQDVLAYCADTKTGSNLSKCRAIFNPGTKDAGCDPILRDCAKGCQSQCQ